MKNVAISKALTLTVAGLAITPIIGVIPHTTYADGVRESSVSAWSIAECERLITSLSNEVDTIVSGYNAVMNDTDTIWQVDGIEYSSPVYLIEDDEYGMYFDFNADNGYAVITKDKVIYELQPSGDLDHLRQADNIYYSYIDKFLYLDERGTWQKYEKNVEESLVSVDAHSAVYSSGFLSDGIIYASEIYDYVAEMYPEYTFFTLHDKITNTFDYACQAETSYYYKYYTDAQGNVFDYNSESNCYLSAMFDVMRSWGKNGYIKNVPYAVTANISSSIKNDKYYKKYGNGSIVRTNGEIFNGATYYYYKWATNFTYNLRSMPVLYSDIRGYAVNHGYEVEGYSESNFVPTMKYVANTLYGNDIEVEKSSAITNAISELEANHSCMLMMAGSRTYGNHAVAMTGYYRYYKELDIGGGFHPRQFINFYAIADGYHNQATIFDPNTPEKPSTIVYYMSRC